MASLLYFGIISYVANSPRLFRSAFEIEGIRFGLLFATTGLGIIVGQIANHRLISRYGVVVTTRGAAVAMCGIAAVLALLSTTGLVSWWSFTALIFCFNALFLLVFSNSASLVIDPHKKMAGLAASLFGCVTQLSGSLLTFLSLPLMRGDMVIWSTPTPSTALAKRTVRGSLRADPRRRGMWKCPQEQSWTQSRCGGAINGGQRR